LQYLAMVVSWLKISVHGAAAVAAIVALGAAAPIQTASIAPLAPSAYNEDAPARPEALPPHTANYQSAPVPDQDMGGPADTTKPSTYVGPKFFSQKSLFQGDGFYYASDEQTTLDNRRMGVPGLGLSVPVK
jgi:hypothetical protein